MKLNQIQLDILNYDTVNCVIELADALPGEEGSNDDVEQIDEIKLE